MYISKMPCTVSVYALCEAQVLRGALLSFDVKSAKLCFLRGGGWGESERRERIKASWILCFSAHSCGYWLYVIDVILFCDFVFLHLSYYFNVYSLGLVSVFSYLSM